MKLVPMPLRRLPIRSLPVWEEWIEIVCPGHNLSGGGSLPVWEEWIEIRGTVYDYNEHVGSLPVWEEWIEIPI